MEKIKILQYTGAMNRAGAETLLMNMYRNIDRDKFEFHFISHTEEKCDYDDEIKSLGGKVIYLERPRIKNIKKFSNDLKNIINKYGPYNAIHSHMQLLNGIVVKEAKKNGIKVRVSHAHLNGDYTKSSILRKIYVDYSRYLINKNSTYRIACSNESGEYLYNGNEFSLVNNAIDINQFNFNTKENYIHDELNLSKDIKLITHIGRFVEAKNHDFIIEVFDKVLKKDNTYRLLLVGQGELMESIKNKVAEYNLQRYVYFLGLRSDINKILASTDVFFMPSILEGLPVVLVEAQAAGVPCVISNNIPKEVDLGLDIVKVLDLDEDENKWIDAIISSSDKDKIEFNIRKEKIIANGYDLFNNIKFMSKIYENK